MVAPLLMAGWSVLKRLLRLSPSGHDRAAVWPPEFTRVARNICGLRKPFGTKYLCHGEREEHLRAIVGLAEEAPSRSGFAGGGHCPR